MNGWMARRFFVLVALGTVAIWAGESRHSDATVGIESNREGYFAGLTYLIDSEGGRPQINTATGKTILFDGRDSFVISGFLSCSRYDEANYRATIELSPVKSSRRAIDTSLSILCPAVYCTGSTYKGSIDPLSNTVCQAAILGFRGDSLERHHAMVATYNGYLLNKKKYDKAFIAAARKFAFHPKSIELVDVDVSAPDTFNICTRGLSADQSRATIEWHKYLCALGKQYSCFEVGESVE